LAFFFHADEVGEGLLTAAKESTTAFSIDGRGLTSKQLFVHQQTLEFFGPKVCLARRKCEAVVRNVVMPVPIHYIHEDLASQIL